MTRLPFEVLDKFEYPYIQTLAISQEANEDFIIKFRAAKRHFEVKYGAKVA